MPYLIPASYWIDHLKLTPHPEGGYYRETYRSDAIYESSVSSNRFHGERRSVSTAIYFLLPSAHISRLHRIKSDELWHFHFGSPLSIYVIESHGIAIYRLGLNVEAGESPQVVIPANCWFGAKVNELNAYTLASCTVSPGFDFSDFEMANRNDLLSEFPNHHDVIQLLTQ